MSVTLLLDPGLLTPPASPPRTWQQFWIRLVDWSKDGRAKLGPESHSYVYERYARIGYPHQELDFYPAELRREYRKAIDRLLASVTSDGPRDKEVRFDAEYTGAPEAGTALRRDVPLNPTALATAEDMWRNPPPSLKCEPPPPSRIQVVFRPSTNLIEEAIARARSLMSGRRVRIIGGQRDERLIQSIAAEFDIAPQDIDWLPCERHKKPPVAKAWQSLDADRDLAICITGRVGHATSDAASRCARSAGAPYIEVRTANEISEKLVDLAQSLGMGD